MREVANWPIRALAIHCVVYEIPDDRTLASVLEALSKDSNVALAEPLSEFHTLSDTQPATAPYNDPLYDLQTNLPALGIAAAHERVAGAGVRIALIDTGVDIRHPDLHGRIAGMRSFVDAGSDVARVLPPRHSHGRTHRRSCKQPHRHCRDRTVGEARSFRGLLATTTG